jgi:hypothetical protein
MFFGDKLLLYEYVDIISEAWKEVECMSRHGMMKIEFYKEGCSLSIFDRESYFYDKNDSFAANI